MYVPPAFSENDLANLFDFIEQYSFGLLVTQNDGQAFASHLPFMIDRTAGPNGTLIGHLARANPQWRDAAGQTALAVFSGPHAYISPTWYEAEPVVPTWNYSAVHVYGRVEVIEDKTRLREIVRQMVHVYERAMPRPWSFDPVGTYADRMLSQIVGIRIPIQTIQGKWKLNQNHTAERRRKVIRALTEQGDGNSLAVAALMRQTLADDN
jgi:transcriptional regulator